MRGQGATPAPLPVAYRGYTLQVVRPGRKTECVHIRWGGEMLSAVPTIDRAKRVVDSWLEAK